MSVSNRKGVQLFFAGKDNLLRDADITADVKPATSSVFRASRAAQGNGRVRVQGNYLGNNDALIEVEIVDNNASVNPGVSSPVRTGAGNQTISGVVVDGTAIKQSYDITLVDTGTDTKAAYLPFEDLELTAKTPGTGGNAIRMTVDDSSLIRTPSNFATISDAQSGQTEFPGEEANWGGRPLVDGKLQVGTPRLSFGSGTEIYYQYAKRVGSSWVYVLVPELAEAVPAGTRVNHVTGSRVVTITDDIFTEEYTGVITPWDLVNGIWQFSAELEIKGVPSNDKTPGGLAGREFAVRTSAIVGDIKPLTEAYSTSPKNVAAGSAAPTQVVRVECVDNATTNSEKWRVDGGVSGTLGFAFTNTAFSSGALSFLIPKTEIISSSAAIMRITKFATASKKQVMCLDSPQFGIQAKNKTLTLTYAPRVVDNCDCVNATVLGEYYSEFLGVDPIIALTDEDPEDATIPLQDIDFFGVIEQQNFAAWTVSIGKIRVYNGAAEKYIIFSPEVDIFQTDERAPFVNSALSTHYAFFYFPTEAEAQTFLDSFNALFTFFDYVGAAERNDAGGTISIPLDGVYNHILRFNPGADAVYWSGLLKNYDTDPDLLASTNYVVRGGVRGSIFQSATSTTITAWRADAFRNFRYAGSAVAPTYVSTVPSAGFYYNDDGVILAKESEFTIFDYTTVYAQEPFRQVLIEVRRLRYGASQVPHAWDLLAELWAALVADSALGLQGFLDLTNPSIRDRYADRINAITALLVSEIETVGGPVKVWEDHGGLWWWEIADGDGRRYLPAFTNRVYHSAVGSQLDPQSAYEFAFTPRIDPACIGDLVEGDQITVAITGINDAPPVAVGDGFEISTIAGAPAFFYGGFTGDDTQTWNVRGPAGPLDPYLLHKPLPVPYSDGGVQFLITPGGIPAQPGDQFLFAVDGGAWRWRVDSGDWVDVPGGRSQNANPISLGLSVYFDKGQYPSFVAGDYFAFTARQPYSPAHLASAHRETWQWPNETATASIQFSEPRIIDWLWLGRHSLPAGCTVTANGYLSGAPVWSQPLVWRAGVFGHEFEAPVTAAEVRLVLTNALGGAVGWMYAGAALRPGRSATTIKPSRQHAMTRGGGFAPTAARIGSGRGVELEWEDVLVEADAVALRAMFDDSKEQGDEPVLFLPHHLHTDEAKLQTFADDVMDEDDRQRYAPNDRDKRFISVRLPLAAVIE